VKEEVDCKVVDMERDYVAVRMYCNVWMICLTSDTCLFTSKENNKYKYKYEIRKKERKFRA